MTTPHVFISHASQDIDVVKALAEALKLRGIDVWLDAWQMGTGDNFVSHINAGLDQATAGLIVFSEHAHASPWVKAEVAYLAYAHTEEGKTVVPVILKTEDRALVPPLLRPHIWGRIDDVDGIVKALQGDPAAPSPSPRPAGPRNLERVTIALRRHGEAGVKVEVRLGDQVYGAASHDALPRDVLVGQAILRDSLSTLTQRVVTMADHIALETNLVELGQALGSLCLPSDSGAALTDLLDGCGAGTTVEVRVEADHPDLLGLPFEALRLSDGRLLATQAPVVMLRRPLSVRAREYAALGGPLKILVAVGAPDEGQSGGPVLDLEQQLQNILDAVGPHHQSGRRADFEVRILEVGHPDVIGAAIEADAYHVLHLSCHGLPGELELEDEDGGAVRVTAQELLEPIKRTGRMPPLVLLNACHTGVHAKSTCSLAEALLDAGVPAVVAMLTSVTETYAVQLARAFYQHLAHGDHLLVSRALAVARKQLEDARQQAIRSGVVPGLILPEYATVSLFMAGEERQLANFGLAPQPLRARPVHDLGGPVPQLRIGDLVGRRKALRETMQTLRDPNRQYAGVVLTGLGGVGKSAVAGRVMQRLAEDGWLVAAHAGRFDLAATGVALGVALLGSDRADLQQRGQLLASHGLDDRVRLSLVAQTLAQERVLLVLDDFEQNLELGGAAFLDPATSDYLATLVQNARQGRLLLTCRYPVPGTEALLHRVTIGPLSVAETRKLLRRLPSLADVDATTLGKLLRVVGGHPRMLELLDALLHGGRGRLTHVTQKLQTLLGKPGFVGLVAGAALEEGLNAALLLGTRDVLLEELLALAQQESIDEALLQAATSNLPVTPRGLARMLTAAPDAEDSIGDVQAAEHALVRLEDLSLVHRAEDGSATVHRWTAQGLANLCDATEHQARFVRAGRYRWWRVRTESHGLDDGIEALRSFLAGQHFDAAVQVAGSCFNALHRFQQSAQIATLATEVLETLPESHSGFAMLADEEATAHVNLGFTTQAFQRRQALLNRDRRLAAAVPDCPDYQRALSVSCTKMGDLYHALGQDEEALAAHVESLTIREKLAAATRDQPDYQRDLAASYQRTGDLHHALGRHEQARSDFVQALAICDELVTAEPDRLDYQRDLAVQYERLGRLNSAIENDEEARDAYSRALAVREKVTQAEPGQAKYQHELAITCLCLGDLCNRLGPTADALRYNERAFAIMKQLTTAEPDRTDFQLCLSVSYNQMGDLYRLLRQQDKSRTAYRAAFAIAEPLAAAEQDVADCQRNLIVCLVKMSDVDTALAVERLRCASSILFELQKKCRQRVPDGERIMAAIQAKLSEHGVDP